MGKELGTIGGGRITTLRKLTDKEYAEYKNNLQILIDFSEKQQLFIIARLNYEEFKNAINKYLVEFKRNPSINWVHIERMAMDTNRLLLNFLSVFRTFLDHTEYTLKKNYGNESDIFKRFKNLCSEQYDQYFSYRFLYKLRNYSQHCGMPVGSIKIISQVINKESGEVQDYLAVFFDRDKLLNKYDSWGPIKDEIKDLPSKIEVTHFVDEVMECISRINLLVIEHDLENIFLSCGYFQNLLMPFQGIKETPVILDIVDENGDGENLQINIEYFPLHLIDIVLKVKGNNVV